MTPTAQDGSPRRRWTIALVAAALLLVGLGYARVWTWGLFDMFSFQPRFADTVAILAAGEAWHAGADIYQIPNPYDPLGRPHVYGPGWVATGALGLTVRDANWIGPVLAVVFVVAMAMLAAPRRGSDALLALALLCSPPVLLGISRGNNDLVVVLLLALAAALTTFSNRTGPLASHALVALTAVLKLYPLAAFPALLLRRGSRRSLLHWLTVAGAATALVFWVWREDYRRIAGLVPSPTSAIAYGIQVTALCWHALRPTRVAFVIGWTLGLTAAVVLLVPRIRRLWTLVPTAGAPAVAFVAGAVCWICSFLMIRSFPYRLVLVLLVMRVWLDHADRNHGDDTGRLQLILWIVVAWFDVPKRFWAQAASHDGLRAGPGWTGFTFLVGVEQSLVTVLTLALVISVIGAFRAQWRGTIAPT